MKKTIKLKSLFYNIIKVLDVTMFTWIIFLMVNSCSIEFFCKKEFLMNNIVLIFTGEGILGLGLLLGVKIRKNRKDFIRKICSVLPFIALLFLMLQIWICYNIFFETGWDSGNNVIPTVRALLKGESVGFFYENYFAYYPNNIFLVNIYWLILKINELLGIFKDEYQLMSIVVVNCCLSSISCWLVYLIAKEKLSQSIAIFTYIIALVLVGLSPWMVICYSDSLAIFMPVLIIYLYSKEKINCYLKWFAILLIGYVGYCVKPQVFIVMIAIILIEILKLFEHVNKEIMIKIVGSIVISIGIIALISTGMNSIYSKEGLEPRSEKNVSPTHYFMMGLNQERNGVFLREDVELSIACKTKKERMKINLEVALDRIKKMGPKGYFKFLSKKMLTNYDDGTFAWGVEGGFYAKVSELPNKNVAPILRNFYYNDGKYHILYSTVVQGVWVMVVVGCWVQMIIACINKKIVSEEYMVMSLSIMGLTIFELLFEARARYLYIYVPIYILVFGYGIKNRIRIYEKYVKERKNR